MKTYTISLIGLGRQQAVVVGGGSVAARKVEGLLAAGGCVTVISPTLVPRLKELSSQGSITVVDRPYQEGDLAKAFLVIAATDDPAVNQRVWQEAAQLGCLINVVDDPHHSNFISPAVLRRGEITIAISTGGASPSLARHLRERLENLIDFFIEPEYSALADLLAELRPELIARFEPGGPRQAAAQRLIEPDVFATLSRDGLEAARRYALSLLSNRQGSS